MFAAVQIIPLTDLAIAFLPVAVVVLILYRWSLGSGSAMYALIRMLLQLLAIGYVLTYIFEADQPWIVLAALTMMLGTASWIALRPLNVKGRSLYGKALVSIVLGGVSTGRSGQCDQFGVNSHTAHCGELAVM